MVLASLSIYYMIKFQWCIIHDQPNKSWKTIWIYLTHEHIKIWHLPTDWKLHWKAFMPVHHFWFALVLVNTFLTHDGMKIKRAKVIQFFCVSLICIWKAILLIWIPLSNTHVRAINVIIWIITNSRWGKCRPTKKL